MFQNNLGSDNYGVKALARSNADHGEVVYSLEEHFVGLKKARRGCRSPQAFAFDGKASGRKWETL